MSSMDSASSTADRMKTIRDLLKRKLFEMAREQVLDLLEEEPQNFDAMELLGDIYADAQDKLGAASWFDRLVKIAPDNSDYRFKAGLSWLEAGMTDKALEHAAAFRNLTSGHPISLILLSNIHQRSSKLEEARAVLSNVPESDEFREGRELAISRILIQEKQYGEAIDVVKSYIEWGEKHVETPYASRNYITEGWFSLAKIYNRLGEYDEAWSAAEMAHATDPQKWDPDRQDREMDEVREISTKENLRAFAHATEVSEQPVFIVGNPRSGTSLLEQILSMHPDVANGGELMATMNMQRRLQPLTDTFLKWPNCIVDMRVDDANALARQYADAISWFSEGKLRTTNKALGLQGQMGFLSLTLPGSRAIMLHRHPLDNCISCYTTNLLHTNHRYTDNLEWLARMWINRRKMQDFWMETLEIPMLELHYDTLVVDQENETRRLVEFLGLPWNDACLQFHKSKRVAATISYDQVNQKMYTSSSGRWKNYEKHIGPLVDLLGDYI